MDEMTLREVIPQDQAEPLTLSAQIAALLLTASRPIPLAKIADVLGYEENEIELALANVDSLFKEETHGFSIRLVSGGYQFRTSARAREVIAKMHPPKGRKFSRAAAETLAVIAYRQPVARAEIEAIRGVDALPTIKTLLEAKVVRIVGHEDSVGQPALYGTTPLFLERFGLNDLAELPTTRELEEFLAEPGEEDAVGEPTVDDTAPEPALEDAA